MHRIRVLTFVLLSLPGLTFAQAPGSEPVADQLFAPELIMKYQRDIALTEGQQRMIKEAMQRAQAKFLDVQWLIQGESATLVQLLGARPVDENAVLAQIDRVLNLEREIKRAQLSLLIQIKNTLSDQQITRLMALKKQAS